MRYAFSLAVVLLASPAYADVLLSEVSTKFIINTGVCCRVLPETIAWSHRSSEFYNIGWNVHLPSTGIPQYRLIPDLNQVNFDYHSFDFAVSNPIPVSHTFTLSDGKGYITLAQLSPKRLFQSGTYSEFAGEPVTVVSHYTPPNGNSFVGTSMRFTAIELTVDEHIVPPQEFATETIQFTARFFGVPEPGTTSLVLVGATLMSLSRKRRR